MNFFKAISLGVIQGLTEFLPISSTAHLRILPALLGWEDPGAAFTAVIQLGTLLAVLIYFARELGRMISATVRGLRSPAARQELDFRLAIYIVAGTIPVGIVGLLAKHQIETNLRSLWVIAIAMIALAGVLYVAEKAAAHTRTLRDLRLRDALIIGAAQCFALIPGSSRSGTTLTAALLIGMRRDDAARYSFLLSIPAVGAAGVFELRKARVELAHAGSQAWLYIGVSTAVAGVVGYASIAWLLRFLRTRSMLSFVIYRVLLGALLIGLLAGGVLAA